MKRFARFIGTLPFLGRMKIRPRAYAFYLSTTRTQRRQNFTHLLVLLMFFVLLHAYLAWFGFYAMNFESPFWVKGIYGFYALVNSCVALVQVHLSFRAYIFLHKELYPQAKRSYPKWTSTEELIMWVVTLGGNVIFFVCYFKYR